MLSQRQYRDIADPNFSPADPNFYDAQFYVHDRLGSVRLVVDYNDIDAYVSVANSYTYTPFGSHYDGEAPDETVSNPFKFTGQWHDAEINQYCLRARMYDPTMMRFTSRDPADSDIELPLTNHRYLYCVNNTINGIDPEGRFVCMIIGCFLGDAFSKMYDQNVAIQGQIAATIIGGIGGSLLDIYIGKFMIERFSRSDNANTWRDHYFNDPNAQNATERQERTDKAIDDFFNEYSGGN